jgi:hypothetical protein
MAYSFDQKEIEYFLENNLCLSNGSVKNCINFKTGASDFVYNEITGYQLSILLMKKQRNLLNKKFDEQIVSIVNYLKSQFRFGNRCIHGMNVDNIIDERFHVFDNCIILQSLITYHLIYDDKEVLDLCRRMARWVVSMQNDNGAFKARELNGNVNHSVDSFEADESCINIKSIIPLLRLYQITHESYLLRSIEGSLNWSEKMMNWDIGLFFANSYKTHHFLHAHCYALEGLQYYMVYHKDDRVARVLHRGLQGLARLQRLSAGIPHTWNENRSIKKKLRFLADYGFAVDASVQAKKLWTVYNILNNTDEFEKNIKKIDRFILKQYKVYKSTKYRGAIGYRKHFFKFFNKQHSDLNAWPNQFLLGAIDIQETFDRGDTEIIEHIKLNWI